MNKQQTAVEWLIEQLTPSISLQQKHIDDLKEQAKALEKQQIIDSFEIGYVNGGGVNKGEKIYHGGNYYNKTFKK